MSALRLISSLILSSALSACAHSSDSSPAVDYSYQQQNWAGTSGFHPQALYRPGNVDELREVLKHARAQHLKVKAVGRGHSWSEINRSDQVLISLERLHQVHIEGHSVRVEAGARFLEVNEALRQAGLALSNLGAISEQTVVGAISTGTHGSSAYHGVIASQVTGLKLLTASGELLELSRTQRPELFDAARVGLGAFGVITEVTLEAVPAFDLEEQTQVFTFEEAFGEKLLERVRANAYAQFWWLPHTAQALFFRRNPTEQHPETQSPPGPPAPSALKNAAYSAVISLSELMPQLTPALNRLTAGTLYAEAQRVDRSDRVLNYPLSPRYREMEYAIPIERAGEAMRRLRALFEKKKLQSPFPIELRFAKADESWMSPAYGRDTCFIGLLAAPGGRSTDLAMAALEPLFKSLGGRPHWGKEHHLTREEVRRMYPDTSLRFTEQLRQVDPTGMFRTPFIEQRFP